MANALKAEFDARELVLIPVRRRKVNQPPNVDCLNGNDPPRLVLAHIRIKPAAPSVRPAEGMVFGYEKRVGTINLEIGGGNAVSLHDFPTGSGSPDVPCGSAR